jgi:hypothetical protein
MRLSVQKADKLLDKVMLGCIATVGSLMGLCILYTILGTIYINLPEFVIGALKTIGVLAVVILIAVLCLKFSAVRIITKGVLAIVGVTGTVYIIYCLVLFALDGGFAIK